MAPFDQQEFYVASPRSEPHVSDDPVLRVLEYGLARISRCWMQVDGKRVGSGGRCISNTIYADHPEGTEHADVFAAQDYLARALPVPGKNLNDIWDFNDAKTTTHADAVAVYRRAIAARTAEQARLD